MDDVKNCPPSTIGTVLAETENQARLYHAIYDRNQIFFEQYRLSDVWD
jgi:hypothetical protein